MQILTKIAITKTGGNIQNKDQNGYKNSKLAPNLQEKVFWDPEWKTS